MKIKCPPATWLGRVLPSALLLLNVLPSLPAQPAPKSDSAVQSAAPAGTILFIGNSFMFGAGSPVRFHRPQTVTDLNDGGVGGVPALFKSFTTQAGFDFTVSLETVGGAGIDLHLAQKKDLVVRPWNRVVMYGYSTLNREKPGDPALLISSAKEMAALLHGKNPKVDIRLMATWSRADQTYPDSGHWHGKSIDVMARDVRTAYDLAAAGSPYIRGVIPVGEAWNRAIQSGVADPNPYDGIGAGQIDLWTYDHYHGSTFGYYLEALVIFGDLTGLDPRSLGKGERSALELGLSQTQAATLQQVAFDELSARKNQPALKAFTPTAAPLQPGQGR